MSMKMLILFLVVAIMGHAQTQSTAQEWARTVNSGTGKTTTLEFYFHDTLSGKSPSAIPVAKPLNPARPKYATDFGSILMADDMLTVSPDPNSKLVGRAQGLYGSASIGDLALFIAMSYNFVDGEYNGSSISVAGRNWIANTDRELAVVGGTGFFRMARGYALAHTHWVDFKTGDAIVGYNFTILH